MRRADRLFRLIELLRGGHLTTADKLAEAMEVSARTIYRDIADLQASGVPIEGEAGVGYVMAEGFDLPPLMFNREEITALVAGARLIRAFGGLAMARSVETALSKIAAILPEEEREHAQAVGITAFPVLNDALRQLVDRIEGAIQNRERLDVIYRDESGAESERVIRPLSIMFWGKVWTVVAWCEMRDGFRMFRLDRFIRVESGLGTFADEKGKTLREFYAEAEAREGIKVPFER